MESLLSTLLHGDELTVAVIASGGDVGPRPGSTITKTLDAYMLAHTATMRHQGGFYSVGISSDVLRPTLRILLALCNCGHPDAFTKADALMSAHFLGEPIKCDILPTDEVKVGLAPGIFELPRGVVHYIGSRGRTRPFTNPARARLLSISWCGAHNANEKLGCDRLADLSGAGECFTANEPDAWVEWDFGEDRRVAATGYAIRHGSRRSHWLLRNWVLEATNHVEGMGARRNWTIISRHNNDDTLTGSYGCAYWRLDKQATVLDFRFFRIRQTGPNSHGPNSHAMYISGFELYGTLIRRHGSGEEADASNVYYIGLSVEARYCGRSKWSAGRVVKTNLDGTFDIAFDDGELRRTEKGVCPAVMRYPIQLDAGARVERRRWDAGSWRPGRIASVNLDGTFNLIFDDKSRDEHVKRNLLRLPDLFWRQQCVEVLLLEHWCIAHILDQHRDGTYDVSYDGTKEKERFVKRERLRHVRDLGVGIPVLARYRGTGGWYSGKIVEVLEVEDDDGNVEKRYSINYDDGAEEKDAPRGMIKVSFEVDRNLQLAEAHATADAEYRRKKEAAREAKRIAEAEEAQRIEADMMALLSGSEATSPTDSAQKQNPRPRKQVGNHAPHTVVAKGGVVPQGTNDTKGSHGKSTNDKGSTTVAS